MVMHSLSTYEGEGQKYCTWVDVVATVLRQECYELALYYH